MKKLILLLACLIFGQSLKAQTIVIQGRVTDAQSNEPLPYANVGIFSNRIGTSTNAKGEFILKLPANKTKDTLSVSFVGYKPFKIQVAKAAEQEILKIKLQALNVNLKEVTIKPIDPVEIIRQAIKKLPENYDTSPVLMEGFFRETVKLKNKEQYFAFAEGVLEMYKASVRNTNDEVKILKGRKKNLHNYFVEGTDTCGLPNIVNGPHIGIILDITKHRDSFLKERNKYNFTFTDISAINDREVYVFSFVPRVDTHSYYSRSYAVENYDVTPFEGKVYIDMDNLAILRAEYKLTGGTLDYLNASYNKNPAQIPFNLKSRTYQINYSVFEEKHYIQSAFVENNYLYRLPHAQPFVSNLAFQLTKIIKGDIKRFNSKDIINENSSLGEFANTFSEDFWEDYNIIK